MKATYPIPRESPVNPPAAPDDGSASTDTPARPGRPTSSSSRIVTLNLLTLGSGELVSRLLGGAAVIYLARTLGASGYGVIGFVLAMLVYCAVLVDGGLELVGPREIAQGNKRVVSAIFTLLAARLAVASALAVGLLAVGQRLLPQPEGAVLAFYGLTLFTGAVNTRWVHLGLERTRLVAGSRIVAEVVKLALLLLLVHRPADIVWVPLSQFAAEALGAGLQVYWLRRRGLRLHFKLEWDVVRAVFRQAWPLLPTMLLSLALYNSDVVILRAFHDRDTVGYYLAAHAIIHAFGTLGVSVRQSLVPTLARLAEQARARLDLYQTTTARLFAAGLPLAVGGYFVAPRLVSFIFGIEYWNSGVALKFLIVSAPFLLVRNVLQAVLLAEGREDDVWRQTAWSAAANITLNLALIPSLGMRGAAYSTVLAEVARTLLAQRYATLHGYAPVGFDRVWRSLAATGVMAAVLLALPAAPMWITVPAGGAAYLAALTLFGGLRFHGLRRPAITV
jgi:O-antigen/teichoic acid export membrane protein